MLNIHNGQLGTFVNRYTLNRASFVEVRLNMDLEYFKFSSSGKNELLIISQFLMKNKNIFVTFFADSINIDR